MNSKANHPYIRQYAKILIRLLLLFIAGLILVACGGGKNDNDRRPVETEKPKKTKIDVPGFNADSAYHYVARQLDFGPRVPGSDAHAACAEWLSRTLERFSDTVYVQPFKTRIYNNEIFEGKNIIGSFNPGKKKRIFLAAHWDSRPYADHDPDPSKHLTPIDGANDGASGTGVLLEIARQMSMQKPDQGIDIILFDLEDYGPPQDNQTNQSTETWGLGSQYWSKNPHVFNYRARFGILLDMVGAPDARFPLEGFSMYYAPDVTKKVWELAGGLGYGDYFVFDQGEYITDDHYFINKLAEIPTINIIHLDPNSANGTFYDYWHTVNDNLEQIDASTLKVVGTVVLNVVYGRGGL